MVSVDSSGGRYISLVPLLAESSRNGALGIAAYARTFVAAFAAFLFASAAASFADNSPKNSSNTLTYRQAEGGLASWEIKVPALSLQTAQRQGLGTRSGV